MSLRSAHRFARQAMADGRLLLEPRVDEMRCFEQWTELILYRRDEYQITLVIVRPGVVVPMHRHMRVDSVEYPLGGNADINIVGGYVGKGADSGTWTPVPRGVWHGGQSCQKQGGAFISFQHWIDGKPGHISEDWEEKA